MLEGLVILGFVTTKGKPKHANFVAGSYCDKVQNPPVTDSILEQMFAQQKRNMIRFKYDTCGEENAKGYFFYLNACSMVEEHDVHC